MRPTLVRLGDLVVEDPVAHQVGQPVGEPLVVALHVGHGAQVARRLDDLRGQRRRQRHARGAGARLDVPEQRPVAGDHRGHEPELLVEGPHGPGRPGRDQHHLHPALAHVGDGPLDPLGDVPRPRDERAVEVDEDQPHHPAGAGQLGQPAGDVVEVLAHGLARLLLVAGPDGPADGVVLLLEGDAAARLRVVGVEDGRHVVVQEVDRLPDDPFEQRVVRRLRRWRRGRRRRRRGTAACPGPASRMDRRCRSSMVARRAASPAASISTALRISMSSAMRSAPAAQQGRQRPAKLGEGRLATMVPWAPRPATSSPWAFSSRRASRTAGRPTPSRLARSRSEGMRSPGLYSPELMSWRSCSATWSVMVLGTTGFSSASPLLGAVRLVRRRSPVP